MRRLIRSGSAPAADCRSGQLWFDCNLYPQDSGTVEACPNADAVWDECAPVQDAFNNTMAIQ